MSIVVRFAPSIMRPAQREKLIRAPTTTCASARSATRRTCSSGRERLVPLLAEIGVEPGEPEIVLFTTW